MKIAYLLACISLSMLAACDDGQDGQNRIDQSELGSGVQPTKGGDSSAKYAGAYHKKSDFENARSGLDDLMLEMETTEISAIKSIEWKVAQAVKADPDSTLDLIDNLGPGLRRDVLMRTVFAEYPKDTESIKRLLRWADSSLLDEDKILVRMILNPGNPEFDHQMALASIDSYKSPKIREHLLKFVAWDQVSNLDDIFYMVEQTTKIIPESLRDLYIDNLAHGLVYDDMKRAAEVILSSSDIFEVRHQIHLGKEAGLRGGSPLKQYMLDHAVRTGDTKVLAAFVGGWLASDSNAASEWVLSLNGQSRDASIVEVVRFLEAKGDESGAAEWSKSISDQTLLDAPEK